jgi:ribosomal protein L10
MTQVSETITYSQNESNEKKNGQIFTETKSLLQQIQNFFIVLCDNMTAADTLIHCYNMKGQVSWHMQ